MSVQAVTWALAQKTGSPSGKAVLLALANYAGAAGESFPRQERLADETEQSVDSVQRRLKELVGAGLIWRTGRYSKNENGGRRSNEYIVLCDEYAVARAKELGWEPESTLADEDESVDGEIEPIAMETSPEADSEPGGYATNCGVTYTANCGDAVQLKPQIEGGLNRAGAVSHIKLEPKPRTQTLPPTPQGAGEGELRFEAFEGVWPFDPLDSKAQARRAFEALCDEDRRSAVKWAKRFVELHEERKRKLCLARTYLEEKRFAQFRIDPGKAGIPVVIVWPGTPQAAAWDRYKREVEGFRKGLLFLVERKTPDGRLSKCAILPSEWPPSAKDVAAIEQPSQREGPHR